jgi:CHAT domain-containing protein
MRPAKQVGASFFRIVRVALILLGLVSPSLASHDDLATMKMAAGDESAARGQFQDAIARWKEAGQAFARSRDAAGEIRALLRQAAACQSLGLHQLALDTLKTADALATASKDRHAAVEIQATRGASDMFARQASNAESLLRAALKSAQSLHDPALVATIQNNLGILLAAQGHSAEALATFAAAVQGGDPLLVARARKNSADTAFATHDYAGAARFADAAAQSASALPDGHEKAFLLLGVADLLQQIFIASPDHQNSRRVQALHLDQQAATIAERIGDRSALAFALGAEGALYEFEKRYPEALALTRRAIFTAQQTQSPDVLYRWEWQSGRLLAKQGQRDAAIQAYRRTVATLQSIRNDVAIRRGNVNAGSSFRDAVGGIYLELADLLLQRAAGLPDAAEVQTLLHEARDTAELLKAAKLEDYFQDNCVRILKAKTRKVENLSPTAAVIYVIPLSTHTEILVSLASGRIERFQAAVTDENLTETVRLFRLNLEDRTTDSYLEQAQQLYTWLIKPLEPLMSNARLDTMVFVPDGALRTIPMSALHDGDKFLVEKYAVAITPGLELMEVKPAERTQPHVLIRGLSESREGFPPLLYVPKEVDEIAKLYAGSDTLMNDKFVHDATGATLRKEQFTIVHIASHGHIDNDASKSFILTFDKHLTLDDLELYIRPAQLRDHPLDLLTLSACQTAAGDDRAALGLAGVAVKAGARSAFATLWSVNDEASTELIGDFYRQLTTHPELSKAQALQVAQKKLLAQFRYEHPCYWAPYLIIGNWL